METDEQLHISWATNNHRSTMHQPRNIDSPDGKVHRANTKPIWGRQVPGGPHDGPHEAAM